MQTSPRHDLAYHASIVLLTRKKITAAATALIIVSVKLNGGAMNHKLISTVNRRARVNNSGKNFHRSPTRWISSENEKLQFSSQGEIHAKDREMKIKSSSDFSSFFFGWGRRGIFIAIIRAQERLAISIIIRGVGRDKNGSLYPRFEITSS